MLQRHTENFNLGKSWLIGDQTSTAVGSTEAPLVPSLARQRWQIGRVAVRLHLAARRARKCWANSRLCRLRRQAFPSSLL